MERTTNVINSRIGASGSEHPLCKARRVKKLCQWHSFSQSGERKRPGEVARERRRGCNAAFCSQFRLKA